MVDNNVIVRFQPSDIYDIITFIVAATGSHPLWDTYKKELVTTCFEEILDTNGFKLGPFSYCLKKSKDGIALLEDETQRVLRSRLKEECLRLAHFAAPHIRAPMVAIIESEAMGYLTAKTNDKVIRTELTGFGDIDAEFIKRGIDNGDYYPKRLRGIVDSVYS